MLGCRSGFFWLKKPDPGLCTSNEESFFVLNSFECIFKIISKAFYFVFILLVSVVLTYMNLSMKANGTILNEKKSLTIFLCTLNKFSKKEFIFFEFF